MGTYHSVRGAWKVGCIWPAIALQQQFLPVQDRDWEPSGSTGGRRAGKNCCSEVLSQKGDIDVPWLSMRRRLLLPLTIEASYILITDPPTSEVIKLTLMRMMDDVIVCLMHFPNGITLKEVVANGNTWEFD